jgi:leucyl aminopeptidase
MEFTIKSGSPEKQRSACVVVGVFDNRKLSLSAELIDRASNGYISEIIRRGDMEGKLGATLLCTTFAERWPTACCCWVSARKGTFRDKEFRSAIKSVVKL